MSDIVKSPLTEAERLAVIAGLKPADQTKAAREAERVVRLAHDGAGAPPEANTD